MKKTKPPRDLSPEGKKLWYRIFASSDMDEPAVILLDSLCRSWDRVQQARAIIARDGPVLIEKTAAGNEKTRMHPACQIERDAAATMMRAWRLLGFDQQPPEEAK